jgi:hypothetical protein
VTRLQESSTAEPDFRPIGNGAWLQGSSIVLYVGDLGLQISVTENLLQGRGEALLEELAEDAVARL